MTESPDQPKITLNTSGATSPPPHDRAADDPLMAHVVYGLYAIGYVTGITYIIGLILAYVKRSDARGTWVESHYTWQIRTFWYSLLLTVIGVLLYIIIIGWAILAMVAVWGIYRLVKGWIMLANRRPIDNPTGWF